MTRTSTAHRAIRHHLLAGLTLVGVLALGAGGWAATTSLSGAVISNGTLVVNSYVKKVQHPTGGIVADLRVRNGSVVKAGDVLIHLDETQTKANLAIVEKRLDELRAREARLAAERDANAEVAFVETFGNRLADPQVAKVVAGEDSLFQARASFRAGQIAQLGERSAQLAQEIEGLEAQVIGKDRETALINQELAGVRQLLTQGLMQITRVNSLEREAARLTSERGALVASIAQAKGRIAETKLQVLQVDETLQQEVASELREVEASLGEFEERRVAALDQLKRVDIRAPQDGIVHELTVHTTDAVIAPGEGIMLIVPAADKLEAEIRIAPQDIDQLSIDQPVQLRFSAFDHGTTPEITGTISRIGADLTHEPQTGLSYYTARVSIEGNEVEKLGSVRLIPGMPVEAFVKTGDRTALSYLVKPLSDQIRRAFREG